MVHFRTIFTTGAVMLLMSPLWGCTVFGLGDGCDDVTGGDISVTTLADGTLRFSWPNACRADELFIREQESGMSMWVVEASSRQISSPVEYGTVPSGASERQPAQSLTGGEAYHVELYMELDQLYILRAPFIAPN
jgi:hypothetical protein